ncbi:tRNA1(Val) (adenine(37)-N6)-methyltransferase [Paucidesulfovibrio longus]|uniref:tRNA1(Val) (adenine(37)-N6)-methyltransferase n=1 Tax=Paucidesulfovibrio longus TaxID=889 RepID=UPI0003B3F0EC|nr:methyltransferase [Paucidesulfovibrio longus]
MKDFEVALARQRFPRGLRQPEGGYRFSGDSLLLASFARSFASGPGLDLGTGCGVVGLAYLLRHPDADLHVTGVDREPEMTRAARENARLLGYEDRFAVKLSDVADYDFQGNHFEFALCNPPFRPRHRGRVSPNSARASARFEGSDGLEPFAAAARVSLKDKAPLYLVHIPERLPEIVEVLRSNGLEPKRMRFVHGHAEAEARVVLLEARKNGKPGMSVEPPLVLYEGRSARSGVTASALAFCPYLQCNARGDEAKGGSGHGA